MFSYNIFIVCYNNGKDNGYSANRNYIIRRGF